MKILYIDCFSGVAGDMLLGAFVDAGLDPLLLTELPKKLNLPQVQVKISKVVKNGIGSTKVDVEFPHEHIHRNLEAITDIIANANLNASVKENTIKTFVKLATAEARVHNVSVDEIHFHEVGALDAIIDITGAAVAFDTLDFHKVFVSQIAVGGGLVKMAHGQYPVPAPATAELLKEFRIKHGPVEKELTTPTGVAVLSTYVTDFGDAPAYQIERIGYGAGSADFKNVPNVLRLIIGTVNAAFERDTTFMLECTIDDMNPQLFPYVIEKLLKNGAVDVFVTPVIMKKGRPGYLLSALCTPDKEDDLLNIIFDETTTIGVRKQKYDRVKLKRAFRSMHTSLGYLTTKEITHPDGSVRRTVEYDELKEIAIKTGESLQSVIRIIEKEINDTD